MERCVQFSLRYRLGDGVKDEGVGGFTGSRRGGGNPRFQVVVNADGRGHGLGGLRHAVDM
jgi:hypothetical protein